MAVLVAIPPRREGCSSHNSMSCPPVQKVRRGSIFSRDIFFFFLFFFSFFHKKKRRKRKKKKRKGWVVGGLGKTKQQKKIISHSMALPNLDQQTSNFHFSACKTSILDGAQKGTMGLERAILFLPFLGVQSSSYFFSSVAVRCVVIFFFCWARLKEKNNHGRRKKSALARDFEKVA